MTIIFVVSVCLSVCLFVCAESVKLANMLYGPERREETLGMFLQVSCQCSWTSVMLWFVTLFYLTVTNIQPLHPRVVQLPYWRPRSTDSLFEGLSNGAGSVASVGVEVAVVGGGACQYTPVSRLLVRGISLLSFWFIVPVSCRVPECSEVGISEFVFPSAEFRAFQWTRKSELGNLLKFKYTNKMEKFNVLIQAYHHLKNTEKRCVV